MIALWAASQWVPASRALPIGVEAVPVPLNPQDLSQNRIGEFAYAGGIALKSRQTDRLHGLSDLEVTESNRLVAVGDDGIFFDAQLAFDSSQRLTGVTNATITALNGEDGRPLNEKVDTDAEGLAILASGDRARELRTSRPHSAISGQWRPTASRSRSGNVVSTERWDGGACGRSRCRHGRLRRRW
jgi:hypothetical protein